MLRSVVVIASTATKSQLRTRHNFGKAPLNVPYPDFLEIQLKSFKEFFQLETTSDNRHSEGLFKVFSENFPITDSRNIFVLEFLDSMQLFFCVELL